MSYEHIRSQPTRLGELHGEFGEDASSIINAIGNAINGVVGSITRADVLKRQSKDRRITATTIAVENTKKLEISTKGATEQAVIEVENVKATYGSITKLVIGAGVVLTMILIAGGFSYSLASGNKGDYEVVY